MKNADMAKQLRDVQVAIGTGGECFFIQVANRLEANEETLRKYEKMFEQNGKTIADLNSDVELSHKRINELLSQLEALQPAPPRIPPKDAKVKVWGKNGSAEKLTRHSAGFLGSEGFLMCYDFGKTSFTSKDIVSPWPHWEEVE